MIGERAFAPHGIEVDVAADGPEVALVLDQFTLEPALKCVPRTPMTSAAPVGVSGCEMLHSPREVGPWRPYQQVEVIGHQDKAEQVPSQPANNRFQALDEPLVVAVVAEHRLSGIAPRHHVVDRAGKFDPQGSSHALSLASVRPTVNRKQGLTPRSPRLTPRSPRHNRTAARFIRTFGRHPEIRDNQEKRTDITTPVRSSRNARPRPRLFISQTRSNKRHNSL